MNIRHVLVAVLLFAGSFFLPHPAHAAQSYDNCSGYIDTLPTTISTGGTWCLRKDLATDIASGNAIEIAADDVTIDCNDFKIGGLSAGTSSQASGIHAQSMRNTTVRRCNVRGFRNGIRLDQGAGDLVEDNRLDNNLDTGIFVSGNDNRILRNAVYDTGGLAGSGYATGIYATADIADNIVDGVFTTETTAHISGIEATGSHARISGNRVGGLMLNGGGSAWGIAIYGSAQSAVGNRVTAAAANTSGAGLYGTGYCSGNTVANFTTPISYCTDDGGNATL